MKPVILLARPRSGTVALRGIVKDHPGIFMLGEIFHNNFVDMPNYYHNYYLRQITERPNLALPSPANQTLLFSNYIEHVRRSLPEADRARDWLFFGINYNSLHLMNTYWQNIYDVPFAIQIVRRKGYHVVHMIRRNIVAAAVSEMRAKTTGVWHIKTGEDRPAAADQQIRLDPASFVRQLRARALEIRLIEAGLQEHPNCLTLEYETFFDNEGQPVAAELDRLSDFLELKQPLRSTPALQRTRSASLRDAIENYGAVAAAVRRTPFAQYLDLE